MKSTAKLLSLLALGLTVIPSVGVLMGILSHDVHVHLMTAGMVLWFITAPIWMKKR